MIHNIFDVWKKLRFFAEVTPSPLQKILAELIFKDIIFIQGI